MPTPENTPELTPEQWQNNPGLQSELRDLLEKPVFRMAVSLLARNSSPSLRSANLLTATDAQLARLHAWFAGYRDFLIDLERLAHPRTPNPANDLLHRAVGRAPDSGMEAGLREWGAGLVAEDELDAPDTPA